MITKEQCKILIGLYENAISEERTQQWLEDNWISEGICELYRHTFSQSLFKPKEFAVVPTLIPRHVHETGREFFAGHYARYWWKTTIDYKSWSRKRDRTLVPRLNYLKKLLKKL